MKYKINRGVRKLLNPNNLKKKKKRVSQTMKKKKNNELQRIMVISFSKEIPIHHEPMITFIVTISIPFFLLTDISIVLPDRIIVQLQN